MRHLTLNVPLLLLLLLTLPGCHTAGTSPYSPQSEAAEDPMKAEKLTLKAADLMEPGASPKKLAEAETLLRDALAADLYHGPAHNDLGVIYLKQGKLYEAAGEFEWARKLMPGHPDPRMNLALTLERAGKIDDAAKTYCSALDVYPGHIPTLEALTRLQLKHARPDEHTKEHLETIAMEGDSPTWREWAQAELSRQK